MQTYMCIKGAACSPGKVGPETYVLSFRILFFWFHLFVWFCCVFLVFMVLLFFCEMCRCRMCQMELSWEWMRLVFTSWMASQRLELSCSQQDMMMFANSPWKAIRSGTTKSFAISLLCMYHSYILCNIRFTLESIDGSGAPYDLELVTPLNEEIGQYCLLYRPVKRDNNPRGSTRTSNAGAQQVYKIWYYFCNWKYVL